uniref:Putative metalloprotease n=1 Tax=Ixodes ricinus TaxID=34613 RepID=A0A0K8RC82_IXORI
MYNGTIRRRQCSEDDHGMNTYHGRQCGAMMNSEYDEERFDCLEEPLEDGKMDLMTPHQFYEKHSSWTPCRASYQETQECGKPREESYPHKDCSISCCLASSFSFLKSSYPIPAPDGEECESEKICLGGKCVPETQHK